MSDSPTGGPRRRAVPSSSPPAVAPAAADPRSTSEIVKDLVGDVQTLVRQEIELAKHEVTDGIKGMVQAAAFGIIGAVMSLYALGFLGATVAHALEGVVAPWLAWGIVFLGFLLIAITAFLIARSRATKSSVAPEKTRASIEETKTWATTQLRR